LALHHGYLQAAQAVRANNLFVGYDRDGIDYVDDEENIAKGCVEGLREMEI